MIQIPKQKVLLGKRPNPNSMKGRHKQTTRTIPFVHVVPMVTKGWGGGGYREGERTETERM